MIITPQTDMPQIPLNLAALHGSLEWAESLLNEGADINGKSWNGHTALIVAAQNNHLEFVRFLIHRGAALNEQDKWGYTALAIACAMGRTEVARELLSAGANTSIRTHRNKSPQDMAEENGHKEIVALLKKTYSQVESAKTAEKIHRLKEIRKRYKLQPR